MPSKEVLLACSDGMVLPTTENLPPTLGTFRVEQEGPNREGET